jgi:hypothetical protein
MVRYDFREQRPKELRVTDFTYVATRFRARRLRLLAIGCVPPAEYEEQFCRARAARAALIALKQSNVRPGLGRANGGERQPCRFTAAVDA